MNTVQPRFVAYLRVLTNRQGLSGLGLDAQREAVTLYVTLEICGQQEWDNHQPRVR
jgi:hypothetical protein